MQEVFMKILKECVIKFNQALERRESPSYSLGFTAHQGSRWVIPLILNDLSYLPKEWAYVGMDIPHMSKELHVKKFEKERHPTVFL